MINKRSIWFLTLFSLILVLSVYYITMPSELLLGTNSDYTKDEVVSKEEKSYIDLLKVSKEEALVKEMENLKSILTNDNSSMEDKNAAYTKMKDLNSNKALEERLEDIIKSSFNLEGVVKVKADQIEVVIKSDKKELDLANKIIRKVQENFEEEKYITVKFID